MRAVSWVRRIAALVLLLVLFPGAGEAIENAVHLVGFGHTAHAAGTSDQHEPSGSEHGCGGMFHLCSCCTQVSGVLAVAARLGCGTDCALATAATCPRPLDVALQSTERPPRV
jgi:hypothetical protein